MGFFRVEMKSNPDNCLNCKRANNNVIQKDRCIQGDLVAISMKFRLMSEMCFPELEFDKLKIGFNKFGIEFDFES